MATAKKLPAVKTIKITYSVGCRVNLGNYEHADAFISRGEEWDATGLSAAATNKFYDERRAALKQELDKLIVAEYREMNGQEPEEEQDGKG